jgi:hypothetical protein
MTERQHPSLAAEIESALRSSPGVRSVYRSGSLVSNLIGRGAAVLGLSTRDEPLVAVLSDGEGVSVEASIAVDGAQRTVETVRAVQTVVERLLATAGVEASAIRLTVVHVQEP